MDLHLHLDASSPEAHQASLQARAVLTALLGGGEHADAQDVIEMTLADAVAVAISDPQHPCCDPQAVGYLIGTMAALALGALTVAVPGGAVQRAILGDDPRDVDETADLSEIAGIMLRAICERFDTNGRWI